MTRLSNLKESKLPRYSKGTSRSDYKGKVLSAASSRSRARDALEGVLLEELRLSSTTNARGDEGYLSDDEILARESENKRAYDDLLGVMTGKLVGVVRKAKSDMFPEGCAYTGFTEALKKIKEITDGEEEDLLREFGELDVLEKGDDPKEHFEKSNFHVMIAQNGAVCQDGLQCGGCKFIACFLAAGDGARKTAEEGNIFTKLVAD